MLVTQCGVCVCASESSSHRLSKSTHSHMTDAVNQGRVGRRAVWVEGQCGEKKSFRVRVCETPALPESVGGVWRVEVEVGVGSLSLAGPLRLCHSGAEVLPAEGGQEHGGRQVHGRQVVGPGGQAGLGEQRLLPDDGQDLQRLLLGRVGQGDLVQNLWRETERRRPLVLNCPFILCLKMF